MNNQTYQVVKPRVSFAMYWPEGVFLLLSYVTPVFAWLISHSGDMLARSGSVMVFFAAVAEFIMLNRMNKKHLLNACRVKANEAPWDFSLAARVVGIISLIAALLGTILWGYGELLVGT
jgi:hypothetical protein